MKTREELLELLEDVLEAYPHNPLDQAQHDSCVHCDLLAHMAIAVCEPVWKEIGDEVDLRGQGIVAIPGAGR